jgi:class 3 adenylate cyclase
LDGLGLGQYGQAFRDNEVDERVLPSLTAEDLKDLGVMLVGHRRRLLDGIAALGTSARVAAATARTDDVAPRSDAERRQLTVMFCDLVGSTPLSSQLDPEDLREVIAAYHRAVAGVVFRLDGFVSRYMGDGVLVYFGYPQAHEDDAARAVWAGLGALEASRDGFQSARNPFSPDQLGATFRMFWFDICTLCQRGVAPNLMAPAALNPARIWRHRE